MRSNTSKIAVFGHYGNSNLGDEAIIEAALKNLRRLLPDAELECFSINPFDSRDRHGVNAFPIRYRPDWFNPTTVAQADTRPRESSPPSVEQPASIKQAIKRIPLMKTLIGSVNRLLSFRQTVRRELQFVTAARDYLSDFDLLLVTGSNQFLDNFGGPWGFPYTLLKWSWIARKTDTKLAFVSVGAGPIYKRLSFFLLKHALKRADYISFRDEGSRRMIKQRIGIDGDVYPDIAHSLTPKTPPHRSTETDREGRTVAVNPMPVFDRRYWYHVDDEKYRRYVKALAEFCDRLLMHGEQVVLFNTQAKDENVIDDVHAELRSKPTYPEYEDRLKAAKSRELDELMSVLNDADVVVATRFHATVLPVQLGKPVMGVCYYRKAVEQLADIGMSDSYMNIEELDAARMFEKYRHLISNYRMYEDQVRDRADYYRAELEVQYQRIVDMLEPGQARFSVAEAP